MKCIGMLKWYDTSKGFGVISMLQPEKPCREDIFIHHTQWKTGVYSYPIIPLVFETRNRKKGGLEAVKCEPFTGTEEEWMLLFDNKEFGYNVDTEYGIKNLMRECVSRIANESCSNNFISAFRMWNSTHPIKSHFDIYDITIGGISVNDNKFQEFVSELSKKYIDLEKRVQLFKVGQIGLYTFTEEEYKHLSKDLKPKHLSFIKNKNYEVYIEVLKLQIVGLLNDFTFDFDESKKDYSSFYEEEGCRKIIELYKLAQKEETNIKQQFDIIIQSEIVKKEDELCRSIERILHSFRPKATRYLNKLLSFPIFIDGVTKNYLNSKSRNYIEAYYSLDIVIDCIYDNVIDVDEKYIRENLNSLTQDCIKKLLNASISMTDELYEIVCKTYLCQTNDYETISYLFNKKANKIENVTSAIKTTINDNINHLSKSFIKDAGGYLWLGETYIINLLEKYLLASNDTESVICNLCLTDNSQKEDIIKLIYSFWRDKAIPTYNLVEKICRKYDDFNNNAQTVVYIEDIVKLLYCNNQDSKEIINLAKLCDDTFTNSIEQYLQTVLPKDEYIRLWTDSYVNSIPLSYYDNYFDDNVEKYRNAERWLKDNRFTIDEVCQIMESTLKSLSNETTVSAFRSKYEIFSFLRNYNLADRCISYLQTDLFTLFEWSSNLYVKNYEYICRYFILFPERVQVKIFKFVFYCKSCNKIDFQVDDLRQLFTCDPIYSTALEKPTMNLSVSVIIDTIITYHKEHRFPNDRDFYRLVYSYAKDNSEIPSIGDFFDKCDGKKKRKAPDINSVTKFVYPVIGNDNKRYYIINFPYDNYLVNEAKKIPGRRYHQHHMVWFVPEDRFEDVKIFAENNKFVILSKDVPPMYIGRDLCQLNYDIKQYFQDAWDISPLESVKEKIEIQWCEGRESQKEDKDVWWCVGHLPCNACTIKLHSCENWEKYTLLDFMNIMGIDLVEQNKYGKFTNGKYALFITSINRFNKLLHKLYCRECGKLLYPIDSNYSVNGASNFQCINKDCKNYHAPIYLNHCYTLKCRGVIDSRDQAKCPNGLVICELCGTCCTTDMFRYRLQRLINVGSHYIPSDLEYKVKNNLGHKDNNKFFCYKCGTEIVGYDGYSYCPNCHTRIAYTNFNRSINKEQSNTDNNFVNPSNDNIMPPF